MPRYVIGALFLALPLLQAADSPLAPGAKPKNEGAIGAGEGPAWHSGTGSLYFTGANRITRRDSAGRVTVFRESAGGANGLLFDQQQRLVVCESRNRRITRTEPGGEITVLTDRYEGHRYNSPNDLTIERPSLLQRSALRQPRGHGDGRRGWLSHRRAWRD